MTTNDESRREKLLLKRKYLQILEKQAGTFGPLYAPPYLLLEIERMQAEIQALETESDTPPPSLYATPSTPIFTSRYSLREKGDEIQTEQEYSESIRKLKVFLCYAPGDRAQTHIVYRRLQTDGYEPWMDEEDLLPGQVWENAIKSAVRASDVVITFLSLVAVTTSGFRHKEMKIALDVAETRPEGVISIIPLKLEDCPMPDRLSALHYVNYFEEQGYEKLIRALRERSEGLH